MTVPISTVGSQP